MLCPIEVNSSTIELTVHTSCYCILDLLCDTKAILCHAWPKAYIFKNGTIITVRNFIVVVIIQIFRLSRRIFRDWLSSPEQGWQGKNNGCSYPLKVKTRLIKASDVRLLHSFPHSNENKSLHEVSKERSQPILVNSAASERCLLIIALLKPLYIDQ